MDNVSVIIPTFNRAQPLKRAVESVIRQSYSVSEILVCDDGSTDDSKKIITSIGDSRIRWVDCGKNGRPAIPRNKGIQISKGDWLAFLDDDDEWLPEKIEMQLAALRKSDLKASCTNAYRITGDKRTPKELLSYNKDVLSFDTLLMTNYVICSSAVIHSSLVRKVKGFPEERELRAIEDYALWLRVSSETDFAFVGKPLLNYADFSGKSIRSKKMSVWEQRKIVMNNFVQWLKNDSEDQNGLFEKAQTEKRIASRNLFAERIKNIAWLKFLHR